MRFCNLKKIAGFALLLFFLVIIPTPVSAQTNTQTDAYARCIDEGNSAQSCQKYKGQGNTASTAPKQQTEVECNGITSCLTYLMYYIGPGFASYVAYIGAYFFSIVVQLSLNSTAYALQFLTDGWTTVRDLANMAFIFILIYIALTVMLQAETTGTIKTLAVVVVIALLVNFSFFFTRVVIDAGNILALQFYNAIPAGNLVTGSGTSQQASINGVKDLSASIMGASGPQVLLSQKMFENVQAQAGGAWATLGVYTIIYLSVAVMLWMLFFTFIQVGIKFMMRIVGLWFVLIASPLAFVARTIPQTKGYFDQWLKKLVEFSLYPAIFLFMFLILSRFASSAMTSGTTGGGSLLNSIANTVNQGAVAGTGPSTVIAAVAIRMGFILALMYVALHVSEWVVKEGSSIAAKVTGGLTGRSLGAVGFAGRNTFGRAGYNFAQSKFMQNVGSKGGVVGRNLLAGVNRIGTASFDPRNSKVVNKTIGVVGGSIDVKGKITPLDIGKSDNKKGYKGDFDARVKALQKEAEHFKAPSKAEKTQAEADATEKIKEINAPEKGAIAARVEAAEKEHEPHSKDIARLEEDIRNAKTEGQRDTLKSELSEITLLAQPTLNALNETKAERAKYEEKEKEQIATLAAKIAPNFKEQYANSLTNPIGTKNKSLKNVLSYVIPKSNKVAADKIRKGKSKSDELLEKIKEIQEDEKGGEAEKKEEKGGGEHH